MNLKGQITISRVTSNHEGDEIEIRFYDCDASIEFAIMHLTPEAFAKALTGLGYVEGVLEVRGLELVGTRMEHKTEIVPVPLGYSKSDELKALKVLKTYEVDGWKARSGDITNHHNYIPHKGMSIVFFRNVPKQENVNENS